MTWGMSGFLFPLRLFRAGDGAPLPSPACGRGAGGEGDRKANNARVVHPLSLTLSPKGAREKTARTVAAAPAP
jgi:hypothetical protein